MFPLGTPVEKARVGAVEPVEAVVRVAGGVAVDHVQYDCDAQRVGGVHQPLQVLRSTKATDTHRKRRIRKARWMLQNYLYNYTIQL